MIALPPLLTGGVKATVAEALPPIAAPMVGAPGTVAGVTLFEAADAAPGPTALVASTVKVYAVPLARPVTLHGDTVHPLLVKLPGELVAV